ncbi:hypothetical protein [Sphingomonas endolithica]|uniref:hypothetical protein n=1 Tax=Sphingomonas endolithica TaxID=2972485 RepID=UPI0021AED724|nr:hypothetical protein [Sphingomonas sp. ZFBP2030]
MISIRHKQVLALLLMMVATPAAAQLPSNSVPVFIQDERVLIGKYRYVERADGMKIDVHLNADHTALYHIKSGENDADFIKAEGFWTLDGPYIHIHNRPGPVRLEQSGTPKRDASKGLSVTVINADGTPAEGLGVTWPESNSLYYMSDGQHLSSPDELGAAQSFSIVRSSDRKVLQEVRLTRGGPNSYRFTYYPSDVEPFDTPAMALDPRGDRLEVEVGTAYARLDHIRQ